VTAIDDRLAKSEWLFRFGIEFESAEALEAACERAEKRGFPHGVSALSATTRTDASSAHAESVELYFPVHKTGEDSRHYTVELPHPVTAEVAANFNKLFGRQE
jgi:hypothetical protein